MGEVWRATDTKLEREVAIKILPEALAADPDRMARFEREAKVLASLNHPNIAAIHGVEERALVMELVPGPTLAERIAQGAMPVEETLGIARQIAEALEAAHEKGIVHRDLKPANVKIKPDGTVKVLDFGLAKMAEPVSVEGNPEESPTVAMGATRVGQILGTAAYMAPEQARGKTVDKRADIWAFGVVLYEMLTGQRLFEGETISDTLAGVLTKEPDWKRIPAKVQRLLQSCLEKDPKRRLRDIADAWRLLEAASTSAAANRLPWIAAAVLALIAVIAPWELWRIARSGAAAPQSEARLDVDLGPGVSLSSGAPGPAVVLSPDGKRIAFVSEGADGTRRLYTRLLAQPKAIELAKTEGAYEPFFSPDGQWVGFYAQGKLKKTRMDGGEPVSLCDAPEGRGASWGEDGNIIANLQPQSVLWQVPSGGGNPTPISELGVGEGTHRWPQVLPGGNAVLFSLNNTVSTNFDESSIAVLSLKDHRKKIVLDHAGYFPRYLSSGHLVYVSKGTLYAARFDLDRLEVRGPATPLQDVSSDNGRAFAQFDISPAGLLAFRTGGGTTGWSTLDWLDAGGKTEPLRTDAANYSGPRLSPDGLKVAYTISQPASSDLYIYDWRRGIETRLTKGRITGYPVWSPDGQSVVFQGPGGMFWTRADAMGGVQQLTQSKNQQYPGAFTPDGTKLVFSESTPEGGGEIRIASIERAQSQIHAGAIELFLKASTAQTFPRISPDGRWLAFADSAQGGNYEVFVRAFPGGAGNAPEQVSNAGGTMPVWSSNGHDLFYRTPADPRTMVASYAIRDGKFISEKPRAWSGRTLANVGLAPNFDLAPDGKRVVALMRVESPEQREAQSHVSVVVNFFDDVRRRMAGQTK
jgi:serine/threonine-protein kinase